FAVPQFVISNYHGPWLVDIVAALCSMGALVALLRFWQPRPLPDPNPDPDHAAPAEAAAASQAAVEPGSVLASEARETATDPTRVFQAWLPWILLSVVVFVWGVPAVKKQLDALSAPSYAVAGLHQVVVRSAPVVSPPSPEKPTKPEDAIFKLNWLSATGTGILVAALLAGLIM